MAERFTVSQINHYLWRRQGFAGERDPAAGAVVEDVIGIYATAPTSYLTLLARDPGFRLADLDRFLVEERRAVRIRAMRYSNFIVPVRLLSAVYQATQTGLFNPLKQMLKLGVSEAQYRDLADDIEQMVGSETMTAGEIKRALPPEYAAFGPAMSYVMPQLCAEGRLVRAGTRGGWKSDLYEYARFDHWLPGVNLNEMSPEEARPVLARHYFDSYGPATIQDFRWWSGLSKGEAAGAVDALGGELAAVEVAGVEMLLPTARLAELRATPAESPQGARLLPVWDAYLMAYKDRARYLPAQWYDTVYAKTGDATSTVLLDGTAGGVWDFEEQKKTLVVKVALFEPAGPAVWDALRDEVIRLAAAAGFASAALVRCHQPVTLKDGPQNRFKSPLKEAPGEQVFAT
ncbi:MAG: winged helix DNA-binding domain-containing protein [Chloroflexi bacterium]|nr:winged helix DNA-binding domain-containing protein [Chloroflexota bacterium]MCI0727539.1 winged helix DNA-binding domain-containing protein [Chloroflexota bacterium]